jgi:predicted nuclease of predicted toxin-antitoxin system
MKLLLDMNLSPLWKSRLAELSIESDHWSNIGAANASDTEIMAYAKANSLIVLTQDLDFSAILAATHGELPSSVVQIRGSEVSFEVIGNQVVAALIQMTAELETGALLTIDPMRTRMRLLPLRSSE